MKKEHGFDGILDVPLTEAMELYTGVGHDYELQYTQNNHEDSRKTI